MKISELKQKLTEIGEVSFKLAVGSYLPSHCHVTEVGLVTKHFIDCGGTERKETVANFQLWEGSDYDHRLTPQKLLQILNLSEKVLGIEDLDIEVEYQQNTIGKFDLEVNGDDFILMPKQTACLASDSCGIPDKKKISLQDLITPSACCQQGSGCC